MLAWSAQLRAVSDELERVGRAREVFLAHVSHELRTPLTSLRMRLEIMNRQPPADAAQLRVHLDAMARNVADEARLVEDLLEAAVTRTGRFRIDKADTDLTTVVKAAYDAISPTAERKGVHLGLTMRGEDDHPLAADSHRLQQALWNVISNAVKFTPAGRHVDVRLRTEVEAYAVDVVDEGGGIAPDMLQDLFEPFSRTSKNNESGLGLGLSIARQIVELHGGSISASSPGDREGTTFTITLPRPGRSTPR
jgi:signal transduction histidine kinase